MAQWKPPDYAISAWKPPDYAIKVRKVKEQEQPSNRISDIVNKVATGIEEHDWNITAREEPTGSLYEKATTPLTDLPSRIGSKVADVIDPREGEGGYLQGFLAGSTEGLGDVLSGLTSPLDLAATLTGLGAVSAGRRGLKGANALRRATQALSAPIAVHGGARVLDPSSSIQEKAIGLTEAAGGASGMYFPKIGARSIAPIVRKPIALLEEPSRVSEVDFPPPTIPKRLERGSFKVSPRGAVGDATFKLPPNEPLSMRESLGSKKFSSRFGRQPEEIIDVIPTRIEEIPIKTEEATPAIKPEPDFVAKAREKFKALAKEEPIKPEIKSEAPKKPITIENAPPGLRARMFRGQHESVEILFPDENSRQLFGAGQSIFKKGEPKPGIFARLQEASERVAKEYKIPIGEARKHIVEYNEHIRSTGKSLPKEGGNFTASSFKDYVSKFLKSESGEFNPKQLIDDVIGLATFRDARAESATRRIIRTRIDNLVRQVETERDSPISRFIKEEEGAVKLPDQETYNTIKNKIVNALRSGGRLDLNSMYQTVKGATRKQFNAVIDDIMSKGDVVEKSSKISKIKKVITPTEAAKTKLLDAIRENIPRRAEQEAIYSEGRSSRFKSMMGVKTTGMKGAAERLSKLKGEFDHVEASKLEMNQKDLDTLFNAVTTSRIITPGEQAHAIQGLFKIIQGGHVPQRNELQVLDSVFGGGFADQIIELHGGLGAIGIKLAKTANTMKAMMSSIDMSAPLRQGLPLVLRREYWSAFANMFKYAASEKQFSQAMTALVDRPLYQLGREAGLFIADTGSLMRGEEAFLNSYLHDISAAGRFGKTVTTPFRMSERAYTGFLNKLRADTFDNMVKAAQMAGVDSEKAAKPIARFVNAATGRGSLGALERFATPLNTLLFSPRLLASRVQMLTNPKLYTELPKGTRLEGIKALFGIASVGLTTMTLASRLFGGDTGTDITSSDFGKSRFGQEVLDPWGGFQQYIVAAARFIKYGANPEPGPFGRTAAKVALNFAANKASPIAALAIDLATAQINNRGERVDRFGNPSTVRQEAQEKFIPIFIQDVQELLESDAEFAKIAGLGGAAFFGMGTQSYPEPSEGTSRRRLGRIQRRRRF